MQNEKIMVERIMTCPEFKHSSHRATSKHQRKGFLGFNAAHSEGHTGHEQRAGGRKLMRRKQRRTSRAT
jgi:hypothetical protein